MSDHSQSLIVLSGKRKRQTLKIGLDRTCIMSTSIEWQPCIKIVLDGSQWMAGWFGGILCFSFSEKDHAGSFRVMHWKYLTVLPRRCLLRGEKGIPTIAVGVVCCGCWNRSVKYATLFFHCFSDSQKRSHVWQSWTYRFLPAYDGMTAEHRPWCTEPRVV